MIIVTQSESGQNEYIFPHCVGQIEIQPTHFRRHKNEFNGIPRDAGQRFGFDSRMFEGVELWISDND